MAEGRQRQSYNLNELGALLREAAVALDDDLRAAAAVAIASFEDDGVIDREEFAELLAPLLRAVLKSSDLNSSLTVLDASGTEPALRVVQWQERRQKRSAT